MCYIYYLYVKFIITITVMCTSMQNSQSNTLSCTRDRKFDKHTEGRSTVRNDDESDGREEIKTKVEGEKILPVSALVSKIFVKK